MGEPEGRIYMGGLPTAAPSEVLSLIRFSTTSVELFGGRLRKSQINIGSKKDPFLTVQ